jgi:hypothetical protein
LGKQGVSTKRTIILIVASLAAIALLLAVLPARDSVKIRGSLSKDDVLAIRKELGCVRWRAVYYSLSHLHFGVFRRLASENFKLHLVSVEGDGNRAFAECQDRSNRQSATYEFTNDGKVWSLTTVSHYESFAK